MNSTHCLEFNTVVSKLGSEVNASSVGLYCNTRIKPSEAGNLSLLLVYISKVTEYSKCYWSGLQLNLTFGVGS